MNDLIIKNQVQEQGPDWKLFRDNFLRSQKGLAYKTVKSYQNGINCFLRWLQDQGIDRPLPDDLYNYQDFLQKEDYSVFSQNLYMLSLKKLFAYLAKPYGTVGAASIKVYPDIYAMAAPKIRRPQRKKHYREMPTEEEVKKLRAAVHGDDNISRRDGLMIDLAAFCGLRVNEIANVRVEDIRENDGHFTLYVLRKGHTARNYYVFVDPGIAKRMRAYIRKNRLKSYVFTDLVHKKRNQLNTCTVSVIISGRMKQAGIKRATMTPHSLRHYAGTRYYRETKDLYATQQFMGHRDSSTTEIYMHTENQYSTAAVALAPC